MTETATAPTESVPPTGPDDDPDAATPDQPGPEQPVDREPPEPEQPAEAVQVDPSTAVELHGSGGHLSIRPGQDALDAHQKAALAALGLDASDAATRPHLRVFLHLCQTRDLDPWAREAYLIKRGEGDKAKFTMQVGIDGFRKMAQRTGRFIRVKERLWTGQDDDDRSYRAVDDGKGGVVMRRVWYDQWPESRGFPGAAKVIIEHLSESGDLVETEAVADWKMYAPLFPKWHWHETQRGKKVYEFEADGKTPIMDLNDMWSKGYSHMLAKCAEALAIRMAFPAATSGVYTHEEMHRADAIELERRRAAAAETRARAFQASRNAVEAPREAAQPDDAEAPAGPLIEPEPIKAEPDADGIVDADIVEEGTEPVAVKDVIPDVVPTREGSEATMLPQMDAAEMLRAELDFIAATTGNSIPKMTNRWVATHKVNIEDASAEQLLTLVPALRTFAVTRMRLDGRTDEADRYAAVPPDEVFDPALMFEDTDGPDPEPEPDAEPERPAEPVETEAQREARNEEIEERARARARAEKAERDRLAR